MTSSSVTIWGTVPADVAGSRWIRSWTSDSLPLPLRVRRPPDVPSSVAVDSVLWWTAAAALALNGLLPELAFVAFALEGCVDGREDVTLLALPRGGFCNS